MLLVRRRRRRRSFSSEKRLYDFNPAIHYYQHPVGETPRTRTQKGERNKRRRKKQKSNKRRRWTSPPTTDTQPFQKNTKSQLIAATQEAGPPQKLRALTPIAEANTLRYSERVRVCLLVRAAVRPPAACIHAGGVSSSSGGSGSSNSASRARHSCPVIGRRVSPNAPQRARVELRSLKACVKLVPQ